MHPERNSLNSSQTTCTFLREKNKTEKQNYKQTNPNNPPRPKDHILLIKCFAWTRIAIFLVLFLWAQEAYCRLMGYESSQK